jgi:hypothetical protein
VLKPLQHVHSQESDKIEEQHCNSILFPIHFLIGMNSRKAIDEPFDRAEDGVKECSFTLKYLTHKLPKRFGCEQQHPEIECDLQNSVQCHSKVSGFKSTMNK